MTRNKRPLVVILFIIFTTQFSQTNAGWGIKDLDPTNKNSGIRDYARGRDPSRRTHREVKTNGKHFGAGFGEGVKPHLDLVVDNASEKLTENIDHLGKVLESTAEKSSKLFADEMKNALGENVKQLGVISKELVNDLDKVAKDSVDFAARRFDQSVGTAITKSEASINRLLTREAEILDKTLNETDEMLESKLDRIDDILTNKLDRIEGLQEETFTRVEAGLQDQVPLAANRIAQEFEVLAIVIAFIVVLVAMFGRSLIKNITRFQFPRSWQTAGTMLRRSAKVSASTALRVGFPMLITAGFIHFGYRLYCWKSLDSRLDDLAAAAESLENIGEFNTALAFRKRAFRLVPGDVTSYFVQRNKWISSYVNAHVSPSPEKMARSLDRLVTAFPDETAQDFEVTCLRFHLLSAISPASIEKGNPIAEILLPEYVSVPKSGIASFFGAKELWRRDNSKAASLDAQALRKEMMEYFKKSQRSDLPYWGRLVCIDGIFSTLSKHEETVTDRLTAADKQADSYRSIYPKYPALMFVSAHIKWMLYEQSRFSPITTDEESPEEQLSQMLVFRQLYQEAAFLDEGLESIFLAATVELPKDVTTKLLLVNKIPQTNPSETQKKEYSQAMNEFNAWLATEQRRLARIYPTPRVRDLMLEKLARIAIRRGVFRLELVDRVQEAKTALEGELVTKPHDSSQDSQQYRAFKRGIEVVEQSLEYGAPQIAEVWLDRLETYVSMNPGVAEFKQGHDAKIADKLTDLQNVAKRTLSGSVFLTVATDSSI